MICGIEIKSNEAIIALCDNSSDKLIFIESEFKKIALNASDQDHYKSFYETFLSFIKQNNVEAIYLKRPVDKGLHIAGANAFRIEALLNLVPIPVISIHANTIASYSKKNTLSIEHEKAHQYQIGALWAIYCGSSKG